MVRTSIPKAQGRRYALPVTLLTLIFIFLSDKITLLKTEADFAIIRLGFRYLSSPYAIETDESFEFNYGEAQRVGMPVGIYFYSNAATVDEAI